MSDPYVAIINVAGIEEALNGMRLPTKSGHLSSVATDLSLGQKLVSKGPVHGKFARGILVWLDLNMPRFMWSELDTYTVGMSPISSESTMYTLKKEVTKTEKVEDIYKYFDSTCTPVEMIRAFFHFVKNNPDISTECMKAALPEGWLQKRRRVYSYPALRNMYVYRKNHRLPHWQIICDAIELLPFAEELLFGSPISEVELL